MKLVHAERLGEAFDSQLVIGVRESYGKDKKFEQIQIFESSTLVLLHSV